MGKLIKENNVFYHMNKGVCSNSIAFEVNGENLSNVRFEGGCNGNTSGISSLVEGMPIKDVISRLEGIHCGFRPTSCPDQLATALKEYLAGNY